MVKRNQAQFLLRQLKKYKVICNAALADGSFPVVDAALKKGEKMRFIIKEHRELKKLHFKLTEEAKLQKELAELAKLKAENNLDRMKDLVDRADNIGFSNAEMARLKELYEKKAEIKKINDTLLKAIDSYMDLESLKAALARAREIPEIPRELIEKAQLIYERYEREIGLFRKVLTAFTIGIPTVPKEAATQTQYEHIEPLLNEFRLAQPFYNTEEFPQHLYEFEIMLNMRKAVVSEDFNTMQAFLIKTNDVFLNEQFQVEINTMKQVVAHFGEVEKIKGTLWTAIDVMDLNTIKY